MVKLSRISTIGPKVCHRFEFYYYSFEKDKKIKSELYNYELPEPMVLFNALEKGIGTSSGIALGTE